MRVLLVHGLGRTPLSLVRLARELRHARHAPDFVGYVAAIERFATIRARVRHRLERAAREGAPYAAVGHSLGGLLVRAALSDWPAQLGLPRHVVMLGTPSQPPRLAGRFRRLWPYRVINGECGQLLARSDFFAALPPVAVPCTVIAGTRGWRGRWSPFGLDANDGIVGVAEARLDMAARVVELPVAHTFMMNDRRVRALVHEVLQQAAAHTSIDDRDL
ncbi:MAG: esterase/lipase family protein [Gemmatimonadales bacterium]